MLGHGLARGAWRRGVQKQSMKKTCLTLIGGLLGVSCFAGEPVVRIVTSFYPMYIATLNVAGGIPGVQVANMTRPFTGCLHDYQLTTEDMMGLSKADIFVVNGAGMEAFLDKVVKQMAGLKIVEASTGIELMEGEGGEGNPHIWVSPSLYIRQVQNIAEGLAKIDPERAAEYRDRAAAYVGKLEALRTRMKDGLKEAMGREIVTFHEAFPYFAKEFDLTIAAVIEREPGSEPSARELAETIELVKKTGIKALFAEPQYPSKCADAIAAETGAKVYTLDPGVTGPMVPDAYLQIMDGNLAVLQQALE